MTYSSREWVRHIARSIHYDNLFRRDCLPGSQPTLKTDGRGDIRFDEIFTETGRLSIKAHDLDELYVRVACVAFQADQIAIVAPINSFPMHRGLIADRSIGGRSYGKVIYYPVPRGAVCRIAITDSA